MLESQKVNCYILAVEIFIFFLIGTFGNLQVLWATARKKELRSKPGVLLAYSVTMQQISLTFEIVNAISAIAAANDVTFTRRQCFNIMVVFIFTICSHAGMEFSLAVDILFAIIFPIKYRVWRMLPYTILITLPAITFATYFTVWGFVLRNDDQISFCNTALMMHPSMVSIWSQASIAFCCVDIIIYSVIIILVNSRGKKQIKKDTSRVIRRVAVLMGVFVCSYFAALNGVTVAALIGISATVREYLASNMVIFTLICLSQTYYVCYWRSAEYRSAFKEQLRIMACFSRSPTVPASTIAVFESSAVHTNAAR